MAVGTVDAVAVFCDATRANDVDRMVTALAPEAELLSPLSGRMVFRGRDDLRVLLGAVYGGLSNLVSRGVIGQGPPRPSTPPPPAPPPPLTPPLPLSPP